MGRTSAQPLVKLIFLCSVSFTGLPMYYSSMILPLPLCLYLSSEIKKETTKFFLFYFTQFKSDSFTMEGIEKIINITFKEWCNPVMVLIVSARKNQ
jgi:hypothetical protein